MTKNIAIVTGASSGMGREFVLQIAAKYGKLDEIWAIARREELLWQLQGEAACMPLILPQASCESLLESPQKPSLPF